MSASPLYKEVRKGMSSVKRVRKSIIRILLVASLTVLLMGTSVLPSMAAKRFLSIATASLGGSYYPIGAGIADIINKHIPDVECKVEVTGGGLENPKLVGTGEADLGFSNHNAYFAYMGEEPYDRKYEDVRLLFAGVAPGAYQIVVAADSGIVSIRDLKGKRIALGPQGGGAVNQFPEMLAHYGLTLADLKPSFMSYEEGILALSDGRLDAALVSALVPSPAIVELAASTRFQFNLVTWSEEERSAFLDKHGYYAAVDIPGEVYGLPHSTLTVGTVNLVMVNAKLDEDLVYEITKAIFENLDVLYESHPSASSITLESAVGLRSIPFHPGAERYYRDKGLIK
jgi:TRAP transporter TAXI family solute receptor